MTQSRVIDYVMGTGSTTGAGTVDLITRTPPNDTNTLIFLYVLATTAGTDRATWLRGGFLYKSSGGTLTLDSEDDIIGNFSTSAIHQADIDVVLSGGDVILRATGDGSPGAPDILWQAAALFIRS